MPPEHMQNSLGCLCLRVQHGIPSRPERKKRPLYVLPTHPLAVANRPLPCNVGGVGISCLNKKGTIFRIGKPVPSSALLGTNIAWIGGAGVRHGEDGGDVFFARDGLGCDGVALLSSCVCVRVLCGAWMLLFLFGTTTSKDMGELDGYAALSRDPMHASLPGTLPPTTGPAGTTQLREPGRPLGWTLGLPARQWSSLASCQAAVRQWWLRLPP